MRFLGIIFAMSLISAWANERPNILFIVSEDNSEHLGCYGEKRVHTPALDRLAGSGVRYTRAYVPYSVCSPSRAIFLTGLYTRQTGHIGLATHKFSMWKDFKTMPAYFRDAGYFTGFLGKTHVNPERLVEDHVDHRAIRGANFAKVIGIEEYAKQAKVVMQKAMAARKPFHLIINYADAHRKFVGKSKNGFPSVLVKEPVKPFPWIGSDSLGLRKEIMNYFNCMNRLDEGVGMVLHEMEELGVRDNTLIVYIADHGADFPRAKGSIYESGTRIPMIVNYPKAFSIGKVEEGMVSTIDILPTMLEVCHIEVPKDLPGLSLVGLDQGEREGRKYIHTFTTGASPNLLYLQFGIRDDGFKLIWNPYRHQNHLAVSRYVNSELPEGEEVETFLNPPEWELYNLKKDPYEWENLAERDGFSAQREALTKEMRLFQDQIGDPFLKKENLDAFHQEQMKHRVKMAYRKKKGFRWPHLEMFKD
ncbi:MAG: sulfatase [Akkermansiaceae bacterium]